MASQPHLSNHITCPKSKIEILKANIYTSYCTPESQHAKHMSKGISARNSCAQNARESKNNFPINHANTLRARVSAWSGQTFTTQAPRPVCQTILRSKKAWMKIFPTIRKYIFTNQERTINQYSHMQSSNHKLTLLFLKVGGRIDAARKGDCSPGSINPAWHWQPSRTYHFPRKQ